MKQFKNFLEDPINRTILWILTGIVIFLVGILTPKADTYNTSYADIQKYYDNSGSSLTNVGATWVESLQSYVSNNIYTVAGSYGAAVAFNSPIPLISNHTYTLSIYFPNRNNIALSSKPNLSIGTSFDNAVYRYTQSTYGATTQYRAVNNNSTLQYVFVANSNNSYILLPWTTTSSTTQTYNFTQVIIDDLGSSGVSQTDINNSLNNQTTIINNSIATSESNIRSSISSSESNIRSSISSSESNIINQNNQNAQNIIDNQNDNQKQTNDLLGNCYSNLWNNGNITGNRDSIVSLSNTLEPGTYTISYNLTSSGTTSVLFQIRSDSAQLAGKNLSLGSGSWTFTINNTATKFRLYQGSNYNETYSVSMTNIMLVKGSSSKPFDAFGVQHCTSKLDDTNQAINDVNDSLNDDDTDEATSEASDFFSSFTSNTFGLTSIITAPLNLIQSLTSKTCSPLHIPLPYLNNKYLDLPCMTTIYSQYFGNFFTLYQTITFGIVAYWVCVRIFNQVKDFKNPEHDEIEVLDL